MSRVLLLIVLFFLVYVVVKRIMASSKPPAASPENDPVKKIVQCSQCKTHIPESEAVLVDGEWTCKQQPCKH